MKKSAVYPAICIACAGVFLFSSMSAYASWSAYGETVNAIDIASVKGQIVEEYEQNQVVYPNGAVDKKVRVKNTGTVDALSRVKIEKAWGESVDENGRLIVDSTLSTDNIEIVYNTNDWMYNEEDGYFYYKQVLKPGEVTVSLFDNFTINGEITGGEYKNKQADIIVNMEMVQAQNDGPSYWNTSFEELGIVYRQTDQEEIVTTIEFDGPEDGFSFKVNEGDLFADFKNLVPGESRSQKVTVTNNWDKPVEIFLWAKDIEQSHATDETKELIYGMLHNYANIVITDQQGVLIYDGPVWGNPDVESEGTDSMKYPYSLGSFEAGETKTLNVNLQLDSEMDNELKELLGLIKWALSAKGDEIKIDTEESSETSGIPVSSSEIPVSSSEIPVSSSEIPVSSSEIPVSSSEIPVSSSEIPVSSSEIPVSSSEIPVSSSEIPVSSSEIPVSSSEIPVSSSEIPVSSSEIPVSSSEIPVSSSEIPVSSSEIPVSSSEIPVSSSEIPVSSSEIPVSSSETTIDSNKVLDYSQTASIVTTTSTLVTTKSISDVGTISTDEYPDNPKTGSPLKTGLFGALAAISLALIPLTIKKSKDDKNSN